MRIWSRITAAAAASCIGALIAGGSAMAAEIQVAAAGGPLPEVLGALKTAFEKSSGHKVTIKFQGVPAIVSGVKEGANIDLVVVGDETVDELAKANQLATGGSAKFMISRIAVAVKAGAAKPDISSPEALKAALLAAKNVAYSQGTSGQHFLSVIQRLGIADALKSKTVVVQGRPVGEAVAAGEAEIGVLQVAELLPVAGINIVGPLPGNLQKLIPYAVGVTAKAKEAAAATAFMKFLTSEAAVAVFKPKGMDPAS